MYFSPAGCDKETRKTHLALQQQLTHYRDAILDRYRRYELYIRDSVLKKGVSLDSLVEHLLYLPALNCHSDEEKHKLLHGKREKLKNTETIRALFLLLHEECASFLNYGVFQSIATEYGINEDCDELKYPEHLKAYFKKHTIAEFAKVIPRIEKRCDSSKREITFKFDIKTTERCAKISDLELHISDILGLNVQSLELIDIKDGCVVVTFLVSAHIADAIFAENQEFTPKQVEAFKANKLIWLKYDDKYLLDFRNRKEESKTLSGNSIVECHAQKRMTLHYVLIIYMYRIQLMTCNSNNIKLQGPIENPQLVEFVVLSPSLLPLSPLPIVPSLPPS